MDTIDKSYLAGMKDVLKNHKEINKLNLVTISEITLTAEIDNPDSNESIDFLEMLLKKEPSVLSYSVEETARNDYEEPVCNISVWLNSDKYSETHDIKHTNWEKFPILDEMFQNGLIPAQSVNMSEEDEEDLESRLEDHTFPFEYECKEIKKVLSSNLDSENDRYSITVISNSYSLEDAKDLKEIFDDYLYEADEMVRKCLNHTKKFIEREI